MNKSTFKNWSKEFHGIATAIKKTGNGKITRRVIKRITSITVERIDRRLLATIFNESYDTEMAKYVDEPDYTTYQVPHLYIVWSNDWIEKSDRIGVKHCIISREGSNYEYSNDHEIINALPVASHFVERDDVKHVILVRESGHDECFYGWQIDELEIIVFKPSKEFILSSVSREIIKRRGQDLFNWYPTTSHIRQLRKISLD